MRRIFDDYQRVRSEKCRKLSGFCIANGRFLSEFVGFLRLPSTSFLVSLIDMICIIENVYKSAYYKTHLVVRIFCAYNFCDTWIPICSY